MEEKQKPSENADSTTDETQQKEETTKLEDSNVNEMYGCEVICCSYRSSRYPLTCMKVINNVKGALLMLCCALLMEGIINAGLFNAVVSTVEKRFQFRSAESGIIASGFDIFTCVALIFITFQADKAFKPLWIGWGTFIMGIGCVLYSIPHFTAPSYTFSEVNSTTCGSTLENSRCTETSIRNYIYVFIFANGLIGLGSTPLFTMAITYVDENVKQSNSAMYNGIYYSMGAVGPAVGYLLGSAFLTIYTDIGTEVDVTSTSPLWVGAWWIGFLVFGIMSMLVSFTILMFPRNLPGTERYRQNRNTQLHQSRTLQEAANDEDFGSSWKDSPKVILLLLKNLPFVCLTLSSCANFAFVYGFNTFGAKYLESVFGIAVSSASLYFGIAAIFAAAGGQFLGGFIVTKFKLDVRGIIKFMIMGTTLALLSTLGFLLHCENREFVGGSSNNLPSSNTPTNCSRACMCSSDNYEPVCGDDGITYFSACFAGCSEKLNETHFTYCSCLSVTYNSSEVEGSATGMQGATTKQCEDNECGLVVPFILLIFLAFFGTLITTMPNLQATLRCVPFNLRTKAISFQRLIFTLLGTVPGRILSGEVLDAACTSWGTECNTTGTCREYDRAKASMYMFILLFAEKLFSMVALVFTLIMYKTTKSEEEQNQSGSAAMSKTEATRIEDHNPEKL